MLTSPDLFFGTNGPHDARCLIVGESWGSEEARLQTAFVGESGRELDRILVDAGLDRRECLATNIRAERPRANKMEYFFHANDEAKRERIPALRGLYPDPITRRELDR